VFSWAEAKTLIVPDVEKISVYPASEIVVPIIRNGVVAVLDADSEALIL
jgi:putative methionine-R-sulfoxide reductase with GAF domain